MFNPINLFKSALNGTMFNADRYNQDQTDIENTLNKFRSSTNADSGADNIQSSGVPGILSGASATVQALLVAIKGYIDAVAQSFQAGAILDGGVTESKLSAEGIRVPIKGLTTHSGNNYSLACAIAAYENLQTFMVMIDEDSTGAVTFNANGKGAVAVVDTLGSAVTNFKAGKIYTLAYSSSPSPNFILQGKGGGGNATAGDIISGKTATVDAGSIAGTLTLVGTAGAGDILSGKSAYITDPKTITNGTLALTGDVVAGDIRAGKKAYATDPKTQIIGSLTDKAGSNTVITVSTVDQAIPPGIFNGLATAGKVKGEVNLVASKIKKGEVIGTVTGDYDNSPVFAVGDVIIANDFGGGFSSNVGAWIKAKEISIKYKGVYRVKFDLSTSYNAGAAEAQIYVNGVARGTARSTVSTSYVSYTEDISLDPNDLLQIYIKSNGFNINGSMRSLCVANGTIFSVNL